MIIELNEENKIGTHKKCKTNKNVKKNSIKKRSKPSSKKWLSNEPLKVYEKAVNVGELTYGLIASSILSSVVVDGEEIELDNSWIDFISLAIDTIKDEINIDLYRYLSDIGVTTLDFSIDSIVSCKVTSNNVSTYRIVNSDMFISSSFTPEVIYNTVKKLVNTKLLCKETIVFKLRNNKSIDEIQREEVEAITDVVTVSDIAKYFNEGKLIKCVGIHTDKYNESTNVNNIAVMIAAYSIHLYKAFGLETLSRLDIECKTRIVKGSIKGGVEVGDSGYSIISDCEVESVVGFIMYSMMVLGLREENVEFRFKHEECSGKEWEIN